MQTRITILFLALLPTLIFAQNNFIFAGGADDGHAATRTETPTNNPIFSGGVDDGHAAARTETPTNNGIFGGGVDDGHAATRTETPTNNGIFGGGVDDGHAATRTETPTNNGIFGGGVDDGHAHIVFEVIPLRFPRQLEVDWLHFAAEAVESQVRLDWSTAREVNHDFFVVERSADVQAVETLGEQIPGTGSPDQGATYQAWDASPMLGTNYYRIKAIDRDGQISYSSWKSLWFEAAASLKLLAFPNPTQGNLNIHIESMHMQSVALQLTDLNGRQLWSQNIDQAMGSIELNIQMGNFAEGMYILDLTTSTGIHKVLRILKTD